jgi:hypothetical protein
MHQSALQESIPFYFGIVLLLIIAFGYIYNYKNNQND